MDQIISYQNKLLKNVPYKWYRSYFSKIDWNQRLLGIKGLRGVGKTTLMLQYLKYHYPQPKKALYVTADSPWFYDNSLYDLVEQWSKYDGQLLLIDEIHKYPQWSSELKVSYDGHPEMRFLFSASSAYDIFSGEADLSRRAIMQELPGMSFREYLAFVKGVSFEPLTLDQLLNHAEEISWQVNDKIKPLPLFKDYLKKGYFPFSANDKDWVAQEQFSSMVNTILESDLAFIQDYSASNILKIKKLLGVIAASAPFEPNISKIAAKLKLGRKTVYNYLKHLEDARLFNLLHKKGKGIASLQKPDKIYFENTNLAMSFNSNSQKGALRETFFINQLKNAGNDVLLADAGDFLVDEQYTFEVGGETKTARPIKNIADSYLVLDEIEYAFRNRIPLWLFGFLY